MEGVLASSTSGLALGQIREELGATAAEVRAALDAGLRARTVRRVGASSTLRYVLNPRH